MIAPSVDVKSIVLPFNMHFSTTLTNVCGNSELKCDLRKNIKGL